MILTISSFSRPCPLVSLCNEYYVSKHESWDTNHCFITSYRANTQLFSLQLYTYIQRFHIRMYDVYFVVNSQKIVNTVDTPFYPTYSGDNYTQHILKGISNCRTTFVESMLHMPPPLVFDPPPRSFCMCNCVMISALFLFRPCINL